MVKTGVTSDRERAFYDERYAQFLALPDHALRLDRRVLENNLENPAHPFYERRGLYRASMRALEAEPLAGKEVLDYGCGPADFGIWMATEGASVTLLDLSPAAIEVGLRRAQASGVMVRGVAAELARIMKPGARLVWCETGGGNPLLNGARRLHAALRGEAEEQGEDIILSRKILRALDPFFGEVRVETRNLLAMGKRLLRGRFEKAWARAVARGLEGVDRVVLGMAPFLRNWCGEAVVTARRK